MSANPAGDEIREEIRDAMREEAAPVEPPFTLHPLAPFLPLVVPGILGILLICGVIFCILPMVNILFTTEKKFQKISVDGVKAYSRSYQVPAAPPPIYVPGNNPNGPFTPTP
jgi:hypothetical protein